MIRLTPNHREDGRCATVARPAPFRGGTAGCPGARMGLRAMGDRS